MNDPIRYDIIADIHGRFDKLAALMARLGYARHGASFEPPPGHKALFLGDLIDTKPGHPFPGGIRATLHAVKAMCDRGDALCLMGNHEWNAILYHTTGPDGRWLRHHGSRNRWIHQGTLDDFPDHASPASEWRTVWLPWLRTLPVSLDLGGFRAVHACWDEESLAILDGGNTQDDDFLLACADPCAPESTAIDAVLKGLEIPLPHPHFIVDRSGTARHQIRARWWEAPAEGATCRDLVFPASEEIHPVPVAREARAMFRPYPHAARPVFFGHYFKPADSPTHPERHNVACLDHSAGADGPLLAYRWQGEAAINPEHYALSHAS
jgi:hypothetical protein